MAEGGTVVTTRPCPSRDEAQDLARELLGTEGTRLPHVLAAGRLAQRLSVLFDADDAALLVAAATLHDIGYSPALVRTGFHPLDGALFLEESGYPRVLARLVANHSLAQLHAGRHAPELARRFPPVPGLLSDALAYADMHSAPDGSPILVTDRLADIARRHPDPDERTRAAELRLAVTRVGVALLDVEHDVSGHVPG
jgi:hypothetical protein